MVAEMPQRPSAELEAENAALRKENARLKAVIDEALRHLQQERRGGGKTAR